MDTNARQVFLFKKGMVLAKEISYIRVLKKEVMEEVKLDKITFEFTQEEHCMSNTMGGVESLTIECMSDMGITDTDGAFYVLKTEQWAINDINDLKKLFDKIEQAINAAK